MKQIYVLEGCDGSGKSTLAQCIARKTGGNVIHLTFNKDWDIEQYHLDAIEAAMKLAQYQVVVLDRWALSEHVYSTVFRNGPSYNVNELINFYKEYITWIYCRNDNAVENHLKNSKSRKEMFGDMSRVLVEYDLYVKNSALPWIAYDYDKIGMNKFVRELTTNV